MSKCTAGWQNSIGRDCYHSHKGKHLLLASFIHNNCTLQISTVGLRDSTNRKQLYKRAALPLMNERKSFLCYTYWFPLLLFLLVSLFIGYFWHCYNYFKVPKNIQHTREDNSDTVDSIKKFTKGIATTKFRCNWVKVAFLFYFWHPHNTEAHALSSKQRTWRHPV